MGSSAKTGKFFESLQSTFWIKMPFGIGHPPPTHQLQSTCVGEGSRVPSLQTEFNYLDSFKSYGIFSNFIVPVVPTSSQSSPCHPHVIPIAPRRSQCGPHDLWSPWSPPHVVPIVPVVPVSSPSSPCHPHSPQKVPMWSPPHVVPMVPTSSPCHPCHPHIIPSPPDTHSTHPPPPWGGGAQISKNAITCYLGKRHSGLKF